MHGEHSGWNKFQLVISTNIFQQNSFLSLHFVFESRLNNIFVLISRLSNRVLNRAEELDSKADGSQHDCERRRLMLVFPDTHTRADCSILLLLEGWDLGQAAAGVSMTGQTGKMMLCKGNIVWLPWSGANTGTMLLHCYFSPEKGIWSSFPRCWTFSFSPLFIKAPGTQDCLQLVKGLLFAIQSNRIWSSMH